MSNRVAESIPMFRAFVIFTMSLAFLTCLVGRFAQAQTSTGPEPDTVLKNLRDTSWYDPEAEDFESPKGIEVKDHPLRTKGTLVKPKAPKKPSTATAAGGGKGGGSASFLNTMFWPITISLVTLIAALLIGLVIVSLRSKTDFRNRTAKKAAAITIDPNKIVDLPFEAVNVSDDPLSQARALMQAGRYDEAVLFLYGYMLLALDRAGRIHLHRGKTNRMYLRELKGERVVRPITEMAMLAFEDVFFGRHTIDQNRFLALWNQLDNFHHDLARTVEHEVPTSGMMAVAT
ncbi:MAG: DUF4129 domain-containing protein [Pirellulales bacterium]